MKLTAIVKSFFMKCITSKNKVFLKREKKKLQSTIFLSYKLYQNLSPFMLQFCSSIRYFFQRTIRKSVISTLCIEKQHTFQAPVLMSRHDYRISICFSDKAVATLVAHWNSINLVYQGPMRKSKLHLTLYQFTQPCQVNSAC